MVAAVVDVDVTDVVCFLSFHREPTTCWELKVAQSNDLTENYVLFCDVVQVISSCMLHSSVETAVGEHLVHKGIEILLSTIKYTTEGSVVSPGHLTMPM